MGSVEGLAGASQSFPAVSGFAGYAVIYNDDRPTPGQPAGAYFRTIQPGFNNVLTISPGAWPPGYRIPNGQVGGGYPASGSQATGNEPIRIQPPVSGVNRIQFLTQAKITVRNTYSGKASFAVGLGVANVNGPNRPMYPYLGYAHDLDINAMVQETLNAGDVRTVTMFRVDTCDDQMDGGIPGWPNWTMTPDPNTKLYPAVAISFKNAGTTPIAVGNIFAVGVVL
jgi:hypothetical protein